MKTPLYILPNKDNRLYTLIIKKVSTSLLVEHAGRLSTYNCLSQWYY